MIVQSWLKVPPGQSGIFAATWDLGIVFLTLCASFRWRPKFIGTDCIVSAIRYPLSGSAHVPSVPVKLGLLSQVVVMLRFLLYIEMVPLDCALKTRIDYQVTLRCKFWVRHVPVGKRTPQNKFHYSLQKLWNDVRWPQFWASGRTRNGQQSSKARGAILLKGKQVTWNKQFSQESFKLTVHGRLDVNVCRF